MRLQQDTDLQTEVRLGCAGETPAKGHVDSLVHAEAPTDELVNSDQSIRGFTLASQRFLPKINLQRARPVLAFGVSILLHIALVALVMHRPIPQLPQRQASARVMEISIMSAPRPPSAFTPEVSKSSSVSVEPEPFIQEPVDPKSAPVVDANGVLPTRIEKKIPAKAHFKKQPDQKLIKPKKKSEHEVSKNDLSEVPRKEEKSVSPANAPSQPPSLATSQQKAAAAPVNDSQTAGANSEKQNWESQVLARLEENKKYPPAAINRGQEDVIYVRITLKRSGEVIDFEIVRSKGIALLDNAVKVMVRRATLPPLPDSIKQDTYSVTVPVNFFLSKR